MQVYKADNQHMLPKFVDCGEIFISELQIRNYNLFGLQNGLLEDYASSPELKHHPYLYTHNVNINTFFSMALYKLGLKKFEHRQSMVLAIFAFGLFMAYLSTSKLLNSKFGGLCCLLILASSTFISHYALHGLRGWHLLAVFSSFWIAHLISIQKNLLNIKAFFLILIISLINFCIGYEFWMTYLIFISTTILLFYSYAKIKNQVIGNHYFIKSFLYIMFINLLIFVTRQIHIFMVLGYHFWATDFYYSFAVKIPGMTHIFYVPDNQQIQSFYDAQHVCKPPASRVNRENLHVYWESFVTHFKFSVLPKIGLMNFLLVGLTYVFIIYAAIFRKKGPRNEYIHEKDHCFLIATTSLVLSMLVSCCIFLQLWIEQYIGHFHPLIIFPCSLLLAYAIYKVLQASYLSIKTALLAKGALLFIIALILVLSHIAVQNDNRRFSRAINYSWIDEVRKRPENSFAISYLGAGAAAFTNNFVLELSAHKTREALDRMQKNQKPFEISMVGQFGERENLQNNSKFLSPDYWIFFNTDKRSDSWSFTPICRHDFITYNLLKLFVKSDVRLVDQDIRVTGQPGGIVYMSNKLLDPLLQTDKIRIENKGLKAFFDSYYNCIYNQFYASIKIPITAKPGDIITTQLLASLKNGTQQVIGNIHITVDSKAPMASNEYPSWLPSPTVREILAKYPQLPIVRDNLGKKNQTGYLMFDLRQYKSKV